jgi:L-alanine-DL-glutamate epimerase-like enolase superfamily enzyme
MGCGVFYVRVETNEGVSGYGECSRMNNEAVLVVMKSTVAPAIIGISVCACEIQTATRRFAA